MKMRKGTAQRKTGTRFRLPVAKSPHTEYEWSKNLVNAKQECILNLQQDVSVEDSSIADKVTTASYIAVERRCLLGFAIFIHCVG